MANLNGIYNPEAEASADMGCIPTGEYDVVIVDSDMKPTSNNTGEFLELTHEVIDGPYKGRKVWARLNLINANEKAVEIANRDFAAIRQATGVLNPRDSADLHRKPMVIRVEMIPAGTKITKGSRAGTVTDRDRNEIRAWKASEGGAGNASGASGSQTTTPPSKAAPWQRRNAA
ncbi:DUF669 domain-containing protein [Lysobacter sp. HA35]